MSEEELVKSVYVAIESCRNGFDLIVKTLPAWLDEVILFGDHWAPASEQRVLWSHLGIQGVWLEGIIDLGLIFRGGYIRVSNGAPVNGPRLPIAARLGGRDAVVARVL